MTRGFSLTFALLLTASLLAAAAPADVPQSHDTLAIDLEQLQATLEQGLKARRPTDFQFIARVVILVGNEQLPPEMIETTFHWARRQHRYYPFPYFEQGLRIRASRIGVAI